MRSTCQRCQDDDGGTVEVTGEENIQSGTEGVTSFECRFFGRSKQLTVFLVGLFDDMMMSLQLFLLFFMSLNIGKKMEIKE